MSDDKKNSDSNIEPEKKEASSYFSGRETRYGNTSDRISKTIEAFSEKRNITDRLVFESDKIVKKDEESNTCLFRKQANFEKGNEYEQLATNPTGRYIKLNQILGKGAYKCVWKAIDKEEGLEVAWNCLQSTQSEYSDIKNEIEILKKAKHKNILHYHDSWFENNEFIFITEMMTSGTLKEYIKKIGIPNTKVIRNWLRQILEGLSYLHEHVPTITHRDLKCDNIFINGTTGEIKIGDLGTAKMKTGKKYTVIGTPEFMAPEMYEDGGHSEKVDIYAFGMCILEIVTGEYPYSECNNPAQIYKKVSCGLKPECISKIKDLEILSLVNFCIAGEKERLSAKQLLQHQFFFEEVSVVILDRDNEKNEVTLKVFFKGQDRHSVKFIFNSEKDTPTSVVEEMIEENILSFRFRSHVLNEINRLLGIEENVYSEQKKEDLFPKKEMVSFSTENLSEKRKLVYFEFGPNDKEYPNDRPIEELLIDAALHTNRTIEKANEWLFILKKQEIITVGDLRNLHEEDWKHLNLSVFAMRAIKNAMKIK